MKLNIKTLWGWRKGVDGPELMLAWDEWAVDEHRQGWQEQCKREIEGMGADLLSHRYATIRVDYDLIEGLWADAEIDGEVMPAEEGAE